MMVYKSWLIKNGALYQPKRVVHDFLVLVFFIIVFVVAALFFNAKNLFLLVTACCFVVYALKLFLEIKKFGWLGEPVVVLTENSIDVAYKRQNASLTIYDDDEIHIVDTVNKIRYIRFVNEKRGNRELRLYYPGSQRIIKYIGNRLKKTHVVIEDD